MKKILVLLVFILLIGTSQAKSEVITPKYDEVIPEGSKYSYIEPIKRPKWLYPLAWVGYAGTCFLVPFPLYMSAKDQNIKTNNLKYEKYIRAKERFKIEIEQCNNIFKNEKDLYYCYQNIKSQYAMFARNESTLENEKTQNALAEEQNALMRQQNAILNRPRYTNSTTTKYGNTYYTDSYSY